ncbi:MAG: hypothetical protein ACI8VI_001489 [Granulosicoccus sp.]
MAASELKVYTAPQTMMEAQQAYQSGNYSLQTAKNDHQRFFVAAAGPNLMINWKF